MLRVISAAGDTALEVRVAPSAPRTHRAAGVQPYGSRASFAIPASLSACHHTIQGGRHVVEDHAKGSPDSPRRPLHRSVAVAGDDGPRQRGLGWCSPGGCPRAPLRRGARYGHQAACHRARDQTLAASTAVSFTDTTTTTAITGSSAS